MNARTLIEDESEDLKGELLGGRDWWVICNKPGGMIYMARRGVGNDDLYWVRNPEKAANFTEAEADKVARSVVHVQGISVLATPAPEEKPHWNPPPR